MAEAQSTILIVDDDAGDLSAIAQALGSLGATIVTLRDPHEVLPTVRRIAPDVVVLDALLPGLSGFDLCKEIKTDADLRTTQVLIVTAVYLRQQYRHEALQQFKADAFLTKPFRPPELQRLIVQLLSKRSRKPQGRLLSRLGLPSKSPKRSILGRLFGRGAQETTADTHLVPPTPERRPPEVRPAKGAPPPEKEAPRVSSPPTPDPEPAMVTASPHGAIALPASLTGDPEDAAEVSKPETDGSEKLVAEAEEKEEAAPEEPAVARENEPSVPREPEPVAARPSLVESEPVEAGAAEKGAPLEEPAAPEPAPERETPSAIAAEPEPVALQEMDVQRGEAPASAEPVAEDVEIVPGELPDEAAVTVEPEIVAEDASPGERPPDSAAPEKEDPASPADVEEAVSSVESATKDGEVEVLSDEPSAAEALEAVPLEAAAEVSWEPVQSEEPAPEPSREPDAARGDFEPSKTHPEVELPESLKSAGTASAETETRDEPVVEAKLVSRDEALEAEPAEIAGHEEPAGQKELPLEPTPAAAPKRAPSASPETPSEPQGRRRARRRVGEAPLFDEEEFDAELRRELSKCRRVDRPLTLILIQVDDLDQIVELFGKEFRDDVLWHVADQAMASLREVDIVGMISSKDRIAMTAFASDRYGGTRIVTRMRRTVGKHPIRVGEELPPIIPALAFGMASYPEDADDAEVLVSRAEEDLRAAKAHRED